jgi:hypothetical protein
MLPDIRDSQEKFIINKDEIFKAKNKGQVHKGLALAKKKINLNDPIELLVNSFLI